VEHDVGVREFGEQGGGKFPGPLGQVGVGHEEQSHVLSLKGVAEGLVAGVLPDGWSGEGRAGVGGDVHRLRMGRFEKLLA
jgi:hypothetical protein